MNIPNGIFSVWPFILTMRLPDTSKSIPDEELVKDARCCIDFCEYRYATGTG